MSDVNCEHKGKCLHKDKDDNKDACMFCEHNKDAYCKMVDNSQTFKNGGY
jgi:hypothetical protein